MFFSTQLIEAAESFRSTFGLEGEDQSDFVSWFELQMHDALHGVIGAGPSQEDEMLVEHLETVLRGDKQVTEIKGDYQQMVAVCISEMGADVYAELELCYNYYQCLVW